MKHRILNALAWLGVVLGLGVLPLTLHAVSVGDYQVSQCTSASGSLPVWAIRTVTPAASAYSLAGFNTTAVPSNFIFGAGITVSGSGPYTISTTESPGGAIWGDITGTLSNQTDLQAALNALVPNTTTVNGVALNTASVTVTAAAGTLTGSTLASGVTASSLTSAAGGSFGTNAYNSTAYQPLATNLTSVAGLSYSSLAFVKMSASGTFSLDTSTYLTAAGAVTSIAGTANQITASASTGAVTLSLPTSLATINSITAAASTDLTLNAGSGNQNVTFNATGSGNFYLQCGGTPAVTPTFQGMVLEGAQDQRTTFEVDSTGSNQPDIIGRRAMGTLALPSGVTSGQAILQVAGTGYGTTGFNAVRPGILLSATENWSDTAAGTQVVFSVVENGTLTGINALALLNNGLMSIGATKSIPAWTSSGAIIQTLGNTITDNSSVTGTVPLQVTNAFRSAPYAAVNTGVVYTDAATVYLTGGPTNGANVTITRTHSLLVNDSTSAASSITGAVVIATTLGTTATSIGLGGGNINAGGNGTFGGTLSVTGHVTIEGVTSTGATGSNLLVFATSPTITTPVIAIGLTATGSGANDFSGSSGTFLTSTGAVTIGGAATFNSTASLGGTALNAGALPSGATTTGAVGTFAAQTTTVTGTNTATAYQEIYHGVFTLTDASVGTVTDLFNENWAGPATVAGSAAATRKHTLGVLDSTSAASSITGALVVAATYGTTATSVGIGGGNINAGGTITSGGAMTAGTTFTATGGASSLANTTIAGAAATTALTLTQTARTSGVLPYIKYTIPTDTAQTASTESPGIQGVTGTRTWATTGTVALQREIFWPGPTYASASASQTFTDAFNTYWTPPVAGSNAIFTRGHTLGVVDATSAASSITGAVVIATTLGTSATSIGLGGGNGNFGGTLISGGQITSGAGITTAAGVTNAAGVWKLGALRSSTALVTSTTTVIQLDVGGTLYSLMTCTTNP